MQHRRGLRGLRGALAGIGLTVALAASGCRSDGGPTPSTQSGSTDLDTLFRGYQDKLPEPANESEGNGFFLRCRQHEDPAYRLLQATAERLPLKTDADVARLGHWARDADPCVRKIALDAIVPRVGFDKNRLVVPDMQDTEHPLYVEILARLRAHLRDKKIVHDPALFDGLLFDLRKEDFVRLMRGEWRGSSRDERHVHRLVVSGEEITYTQKGTKPDPASPDRESKARVAEATVNERGGFALPGTSMSVQPITRDVAWLDDGYTRGVKLRRVGR